MKPVYALSSITSLLSPVSRRIASVALLLLLISGCGSYQTSIQTENQSYLQIGGSLKKAELLIDDTGPFNLEEMESFNLNGRKVTKIEIPAGHHVVTVNRSGQRLIYRKIYVSEGQVFELNVP